MRDVCVCVFVWESYLFVWVCESKCVCLFVCVWACVSVSVSMCVRTCSSGLPEEEVWEQKGGCWLSGQSWVKVEGLPAGQRDTRAERSGSWWGVRDVRGRGRGRSLHSWYSCNTFRNRIEEHIVQGSAGSCGKLLCGFNRAEFAQDLIGAKLYRQDRTWPLHLTNRKSDEIRWFLLWFALFFAQTNLVSFKYLQPSLCPEVSSPSIGCRLFTEILSVDVVFLVDRKPCPYLGLVNQHCMCYISETLYQISF